MAGKARDIRTFFRPVPPRKPAAAPPPSLPAQASSESSSALSSPPSSVATPADSAPLPARPAPTFSTRAGSGASTSPSRPQQQASRPRDAVVQASDDEGSSGGSDSDDSLEDVDAIWRRANPERAAVAAAKEGGDPATPRAAKRTAVATTPLTIRAKRLQQAHKYDMSALLRQNQDDLDAEASGQRVEALLSGRGWGGAGAGGTSVAGGPAGRLGGSSPFSSTSSRAANAYDDDSEEALVRNLEEYIPDNEDDEAAGGNGSGAATGKAKGKAKLKQAIKRTEATDVARRCVYFFGRDLDPVVSAQQPQPLFPKHCATGRWRLLKAVGTRDQHFLAGLPEQLARRGARLQLQPLPDEIFFWILRQVPLEQDRRLREQYVLTASAVVEVSSEPDDGNLGRRVDEAFLFELFRSLGCKRQSLGDKISAKLSLDEQVPDYYAGRDWSNLVSVLQLIAALCRAGCRGGVHPFPLPTITFATQLLLQLGLDRVVVEDVAVAISYQAALAGLVESVAEGDWNVFCYDVVKCFYSNVQASHLRWQAIGCLGPDTGQRWLLDLQRRLALACLLDDPEYARRAPDRGIGIQALADRLGSGVFLITHETDYRELAAMLRFLDVALSDGLDRSVEDLDAQLDRLCHQVELVWRKIYASGAGQSSRLDAKTVADWIRDRITYTVRTRPPPKTSIYDGGQLRDDDRATGLKQQDIKKMFQAKIMSASSKRDETTIRLRTS